MGQLATRTKKTAKKEVLANKTKTLNKAGGIAFKITDPAEYLLATIGSALFVEPKYYPDNVDLKEIKVAGFNHESLDEQAVRIINACIEISETKNPRDVLALANWCRTEMHMRTTPCVMVAVAAKCASTKQWVRKYVPLVAQRPDDIKQIVAAYEHLFGWKAFPASLKKGVADAMSKVKEYGFMKYDGEGHPSWKDILSFVERRKGYPVSQEVLEYLMNGKILDAKKTPVFAARKRLNSMTEWTDEVPELAKLSQATWEVLVSQFGSKKEVWQAVIPMMGYMALMRNLANFLSADVHMNTLKRVAGILSDRDRVLKSKQLPFRFLSAHRTLNPDHSRGYGRGPVGRDRSGWKPQKLSLLLDALDEALDASVENLVGMPGDTCIVTDTSGSMQQPLSDKSSLSVMDAGVALAALAYKSAAKTKSGQVYCGAFASNPAWPRLSKKDSVLTIMEKLLKAETHGWSTEAWKVFEYLRKNKIKVDRIILLSDMQCYGTNGWGYSSQSVAEYLAKYRKQVNPKCVLHSVHLNGHDDTTQAPRNETGRKKNNIMSGFHPNMFAHFMRFEGVEAPADEKGEAVQIPSLEYIRENY